MIYDAAVIGAGVTGSMIARELSMYDMSVCVIEAAADVAAGASRANSGIVHAGYDAIPGTLKAKMNRRGNALMKQTAKELGVPYLDCGSLVLAFCDDDDRHVRELHDRGEKNGVLTEILSFREVVQKEPMVSAQATSALYAPSAGIICPYTLTIAAMENAAGNGVQVFLDSRVTEIAHQDGVYELQAGKNHIRARYLINAAGLYADDISKMAGGEVFEIRARKGEYIVFDNSMAARVGTVLFGTPSERGKGVLLTPTAHGNMMAGPTSEYTDNKADKSTSGAGLEAVFCGAKQFVPDIDTKSAITVFAGLRAVCDRHDFIIERSKSAPNLINVAGIESPGLTSAPAIAQYVCELLFTAGLEASKKQEAKRTRTPIEAFAHATPARRQELIKKDARYANVVCRCEHVTEAEIVESILRPCGARTVDGVKFRTRAGMGRCHGGFCLPRVMAILARERGQDIGDITKSGGDSQILTSKTKEGQS